MNPFIQGSTATQSNTSLPVFQEYAWNFDTDTFIFEAGGKHKIVTENEALKVWIYKTLKTERWRYRAYDSSYGIELEQFIGRRINNSDSATEVERYVEEALFVNPYIISIDEVSSTTDGDLLELDISLTTIYGALKVTVKI